MYGITDMALLGILSVSTTKRMPRALYGDINKKIVISIN